MLLLAPILTMLAATVLLHFLPSLVRPDIFFGVTVQGGFRRTGTAAVIVRAYRVILWGVTAVAVIAALVLPHKFAPLVPQVYGLCVLADLALMHRRARPHAVKPATVVEVDLTAPAERLPGGPLVAVVPLLWLTGLAVWSALEEAAPAPLLYRFAAAAWMCLMLAVMAWGVLHWSRRVSTSGAAAAKERRFRRHVVMLVLACEYFLALPPTFDAFNVPRFAKLGWRAALLLIIVVFVLSLMSAGQGGTRKSEGPEGAPVGDRTADEHWHWGLFYFNPADPALMVEKRMGIGYTLNFGNPWAWLMLVGLVGVSLVVRTIAPR